MDFSVWEICKTHMKADALEKSRDVVSFTLFLWNTRIIQLG
jgi:hypothetical protein